MSQATIEEGGWSVIEMLECAHEARSDQTDVESTF